MSNFSASGLTRETKTVQRARADEEEKPANFPEWYFATTERIWAQGRYICYEIILKMISEVKLNVLFLHSGNRNAQFTKERQLWKWKFTKSILQRVQKGMLSIYFLLDYFWLCLK